MAHGDPRESEYSLINTETSPRCPPPNPGVSTSCSPRANRTGNARRRARRLVSSSPRPWTRCAPMKNLRSLCGKKV